MTTLQETKLSNGIKKALVKLSTGTGYAVITTKPNKDMYAESFTTLAEAQSWFKWA